MPEKRLLDAISEGDEAFWPGVYEEYLKEAQRRGISLSHVKIETSLIKKKAKNLVGKGYIGTIVGFGFGGILAASHLLFKKGIDGKPFYPSKYRTHGIIIFSISICVMIGFLVFFVLLVVIWF
jgi:hypothetical protein